MIRKIKSYCEEVISEFEEIPSSRKALLEKLAAHINFKLQSGMPVNLVYICTHNSRRSHFGQIWAKAAADYFDVPRVYTFSGGTEATSFNRNAINALIRAGFLVNSVSADKNAVYQVMYDTARTPVECFSKVYDHPANPHQDFVAIMTCGEAEENCPFIPGAELRIATTYDDPKAFDNTPLQDAKYDERCRQIARETMYVFSCVDSNQPASREC